MSYNTRRNAGSMQSPQVSYHQAPNTPQRGAPQRPGGPNAAYASHFSTPVAYNTQPGYNTVKQQQQPPQPQTPQDVKPPAPVAAQPAAPQAPAQPPKTPQEPAAPAPAAVAAATAAANPPVPAAATLEAKMETEGDSASNGATGGGPQKPAWMKKALSKLSKKLTGLQLNPDITTTTTTRSRSARFAVESPASFGVKVNKVQKRRRQNARLRKILVPKNALMAINEICPGPKFMVQEHTNALNQTIYSVRLEIDGKIHSGQSINKTHAKQMACENALKDILVTRMQTQMQSGPSNFFTQQEEMDDSESVDGPVRTGQRQPEDDMPWGCLASFALHKLFIEWQNQGVEIPMANAQPILRKARSPSISKAGVVQGTVHPIKKMPEDANKKHPVLMLNHLQPGLQYSERIEGSLPNAVFVFTVNIDGQEFTGSGSTKKEAKKECAKAALVKFGIISEY